MRKKIFIVVAAAGLLATGCAGGSSGSHASSTKPRPSATVLPQKLADPGAQPDAEPQPSPAADAPFTESLAYELRRRTLKMAGAPGTTTAECPKGLESKSGTKATCTTTYEGLKVEWDVSIGDKSAISNTLVEYTATPRQGILTRDGVARLLYGNYRGSIDHPQCNNIPAATLVPLNTPSQYACEVVFKGEAPGGHADAVRATPDGPRAF
ncbi:hypothetical protein [Streptomyces sp. NPDC051994]|uniref:hypothetical protein n=1 Tax=unclassified Streptomyces TaxID=2593676 RepID=UPI003418C191